MKGLWIAGATGYTGSALVRQAAADGLPVTAHIRPDSKTRSSWEALWTEQGAQIDPSPWDEAALTKALQERQIDIIVCAIGTTQARFRGRSAEEKAALDYEAVDYGLTALLLRAAQASGRSPRFVYLSSMGAGPRSSLPYIQARWKAEEAVRSSGLPYLIARPGFISGADRRENRTLERLGARLSDGLLSFFGLLFGKERRWFRRYRSFSASELASCLLSHALHEPFQSLVLEAEDLRGSAPEPPQGV